MGRVWWRASALMTDSGIDTQLVEPSDARSEDERPERLLVVPRLDCPDGASYLLVRWMDWPYPALLSLTSPRCSDSLADAVTALLHARLGLRCDGKPQMAALRMPVRLMHPRFGGYGLGWLRPVAVSVGGEPQPDALLEGVEALTLEQAL